MLFRSSPSPPTANLSNSCTPPIILPASSCVASKNTLGTISSPSGCVAAANSASFQRVAQRHQVHWDVGEEGESGPEEGKREERSFPRCAEKRKKAGVISAATTLLEPFSRSIWERGRTGVRGGVERRGVAVVVPVRSVSGESGRGGGEEGGPEESSGGTLTYGDGLEF